MSNPIYPYSEETGQFLQRLERQIENTYDPLVQRGDKGEILYTTLFAFMPNGDAAFIVASLQPWVGDWAAYLGAGNIRYAKDYGAKLEEHVARACFPDVPADLYYRP